MEPKKEYQEYLENVLRFLKIDFDCLDEILVILKETEPAERVTFNEMDKTFCLGMAVWDADKVISHLKEIRSAIIDSLNSVADTGKIGEKELETLNIAKHDLKILHIYDPDAPSHIRLGYDVPDSKLAWEETICPHCGATVNIHLFPDPIPVFAYEAVINMLRLLTREVPLTRSSDGMSYAIKQ